MSEPTDAPSFYAALRGLVGDDASGSDEGPWRIAGVGPNGFDLRVEASDDEVCLTIEGWTHREPLDDPQVWSEVLDFVAAVRWGKIALVLTRSGEKVLRGEVIYGSADVRRALGQWGGGWRTWRPGTAKVTLRNDAAPPAAATDGGSSPQRPWIGVRGRSADATEAKALAVDGELDLHPFSPKEVKPLVLEYIEACRAEGIVELRIVHGKGIGNLRRTVHALLDRHEAVASYRLGGMGEGSWGATLVQLHPADGHSSTAEKSS